MAQQHRYLLTSSCKHRYEDGDNEHILWEELKEILISLPGKDEAEEATTPAVVTKPKRTAGKTGKHPFYLMLTQLVHSLLMCDTVLQPVQRINQ